MISLAVMVPLISSTWPLECTMRTTSRAPHGRMQEMQHLMVFFMAPSLSATLIEREEEEEEKKRRLELKKKQVGKEREDT